MTRLLDRTFWGLTIGLVALFALNFLLEEWMRTIGLQTLSRGLVAIGLLILWRAHVLSCVRFFMIVFDVLEFLLRETFFVHMFCFCGLRVGLRFHKFSILMSPAHATTQVRRLMAIMNN